MADPAFAPFIDADHIGAVGFSLGGATALGLAGVRFDGAAQDVNCATSPEAADCVFFRLGGVRFADHPGFDGDARDTRVTQAVIIDPGFGGAVDADTLSDALPGITLINLGDADRLGAADVSPEGNDLARRLPGTSYIEITPANHFTFLGTCKSGAVEMLEEYEDDPICTDPEGTDRAATHMRLIDAIASGLGL